MISTFVIAKLLFFNCGVFLKIRRDHICFYKLLFKACHLSICICMQSLYYKHSVIYESQLIGGGSFQSSFYSHIDLVCPLIPGKISDFLTYVIIILCFSWFQTCLQNSPGSTPFHMFKNYSRETYWDFGWDHIEIVD